LQPNDRGVNGALSNYTKKFKHEVDLNAMSPMHVRYELIKITENALYHAMAPRTIKRAWLESGLFPWSLSQMLSSPHVRAAADGGKSERVMTQLSIRRRGRSASSLSAS